MIKYNVRAKIRTYKDDQGEDKAVFNTVGCVMSTKKGLMLKLDTIPVCSDGWFYLMEPLPVREDIDTTVN